MSFVVAGTVLMLAFVAATTSWIFAPIYQAQAEPSGGETSTLALAPTKFNVLKSLPRSNWLVICTSAILCGVGAWSLSEGGTAMPTLIRHGIALVFIMSAMLFDLRTHLIPNFLIIAMLLFGVAMLFGEFLFFRPIFRNAAISAGVGLIVCLPIFYLLSILTRNGLGMGDVKLISAMAWLLGLTVTLFSVLFGLILCTLTAIFLMLMKKKTKTDFLPFAPFVFGGYVLLLIFFSV